MKSEKIKHIYHVQGTFSLLVIMEQRRAWVEGSRGCAKQPGATVCGVELKTRRVERMTCSALYLLYFSNKCPMWFSTIHRSMTSKNFCAQKMQHTNRRMRSFLEDYTQELSCLFKLNNLPYPWKIDMKKVRLLNYILHDSYKWFKKFGCHF